METNSFKSFSIEQLEQAIAAAITSLTNTEATVSIGMVKQLGDGWSQISSKQEFAIELTASVQQSYRTRPRPPARAAGEPVGDGGEDKPF